MLTSIILLAGMAILSHYCTSKLHVLHTTSTLIKCPYHLLIVWARLNSCNNCMQSCLPHLCTMQRRLSSRWNEHVVHLLYTKVKKSDTMLHQFSIRENADIMEWLNQACLNKRTVYLVYTIYTGILWAYVALCLMAIYSLLIMTYNPYEVTVYIAYA